MYLRVPTSFAQYSRMIGMKAGVRRGAASPARTELEITSSVSIMGVTA